MPELPVLSGHDVIDVLERLGFERVRQRGSHVVMRRGSTGCVVPLHRTIKRGTLGGLIRQAGLTAADFIAGCR